MAFVSSQFVPSRCYICVISAGIAFVLQGCGSGDLTQCEVDAFKAEAEPCLNAIDLPADKCMGVSDAVGKCWEKGAAAGGPCMIEETSIWFASLVDKKFAGAKTTFQDNANKCLQAATFEKNCESEQNKKTMDDCWKPAEEAAGGEWKADAQGIVSQCPYNWFFESLKASQPEHSAWFGKECTPKSPN